MKLNYSSPSTSIKNYSESKLAKMETNDCVVRAIASASNWDYDKAHKFVEDKFQRQFRRGTLRFNSRMTILSIEDIKLNRKKIKTISSSEMMNGKSKMTVGSFAKKYNKGTYILVVKGHAFSIRNGEVIGGNREDAIKTRRILKGVWKIGSN